MPITPTRNLQLSYRIRRQGFTARVAMNSRVAGKRVVVESAYWSSKNPVKTNPASSCPRSGLSACGRIPGGSFVQDNSLSLGVIQGA